VAFVTKWVVTQGDIVAHSDGEKKKKKKKWGGFDLCQRLKGGFERPCLLASQVGLFGGRLGRLISSG
jgi:hypothetical protein